jgi:hypothetical protein
MADYKALCADLTREVEGLYEVIQEMGCGWISPESEAIIARSYSALAETGPQPTDGEISEYWIEFFPEYGSTDPIAWANAVLSRWGSQTPKPIPLSERLPEATDCDGQGRCWIFRYENPECKGLFEWEYRVLDLSTDDWLPPVMCWLPYYSMPFPKYD